MLEEKNLAENDGNDADEGEKKKKKKKSNIT